MNCILILAVQDVYTALPDLYGLQPLLSVRQSQIIDIVILYIINSSLFLAAAAITSLLPLMESTHFSLLNRGRSKKLGSHFKLQLLSKVLTVLHSDLLSKVDLTNIVLLVSQYFLGTAKIKYHVRYCQMC